MAKKNPAATDSTELDETKTPPETNPAPTPPPAVDNAPLLVCVGGYNHVAVASDDVLEIAAKGLPGDFSMADVKRGYFPGQFVRWFEIVSHKLDGKTLRIVIAKQP